MPSVSNRSQIASLDDIADIHLSLFLCSTTVSPILLQSLQEKHEASLVGCCWKSVARHSKKVKTEVGWEAVASRVLLWVLPQVFFQLMSVYMEPPYFVVDMHADGVVGRGTCMQADGRLSSWLVLGYIWLAVLMVTLMYQAHSSRSLPSLFNETKDIFGATMTTIAIAFLGLGIAAVANSPSTPPSVNYIIWTTTNLSSTLNSSLRIVVPKLRMIWRGETVVVSRLLSDHKQRVMKDNMLYERRVSQVSSMFEDDSNVPLPINPWTLGSITDSGDRHIPSIDSSISSEEQKGPLRRRSKVVVGEDEAPSRYLFLKLLNMQQSLARLNATVISGRKVSVDDWERLRDKSFNLASTFRNEVKFTWDENRIFRRARRKRGNSSGDDSSMSEEVGITVEAGGLLDESLSDDGESCGDAVQVCGHPGSTYNLP